MKLVICHVSKSNFAANNEYLKQTDSRYTSVDQNDRFNKIKDKVTSLHEHLRVDILGTPITL